MTEDEKTQELTEKYEGKKPKERKSKTKDKDFLDLMRKRHKREVRADKDNREEAVKDQKFRRAGVKDQWDSQELMRRKKMMRPAIVLDELSRPINQVTGEMRLNKAHIHVLPADDDASLQVAKAYKDIIHEIEYDSKADRIYQYAGDMLCGCAYGAWRVLERYSKENPFEQEIYIERIKNPLLVYMDSSARDDYYADAKYGFVMEKVTKDEWEEMFEGKEFPSAEKWKDMPGTNMELWFEEDGIWVADYYVIEPEKTTYVMLENDDVIAEDELSKAKTKWQEEQEEILEEKMKAWRLMQEVSAMQQAGAIPASPPQGVPQPQPGQPQNTGNVATNTGTLNIATGMNQSLPTAPPTGQQSSAPQGAPASVPAVSPNLPMPEMPPLPPSLTIAKDKKKNERKREIEVPRVKHYVVAADQILQGPHDIPGSYIPIVLAHGIETNVEGKTEYSSLIRKAKGSQSLLNQVETAKAEIIDMMPKAPWIMTFKQYAAGGELFDAANIENRGALLYDPEVVMAEDGTVAGLAPKPERVSIGQMPVALFQYSENIKGYIEDALGVARADTMNVPSPERTGAASRGKRKSSDVGTFHFIDNLNGAIEHGARIIVSKIPEVYDTDRDVRTMSDDEVQSFIPVNTTAADALKRVKSNQGRYTGINVQELEARAKEHPSSEYNKLSKGRYDVFTKVGPPFSTAREEASEQFMTLATQGQRMNALDKYYAVKHLDLGDGGEYEESLKRLIPPWMLPPKEGEQRAQAPENPQQQLAKAKIMTEQAKLKQQELHMKLRMIEIQKELVDKGEKAIDEEKELRKIINDELRVSMFGDKTGGR
jgi:hypothetical protein